MSKKSRLKKKNKQKLQKRFEQIAPEVAVDAETPDDVVDDKQSVQVSDKKADNASTESDSIIDAPTRKAISKDVRMIIFTLVGLALVLVAVRILEFKTDYISTFGDWLYKITNIQTL
ncbi:MAG: hypothetical protein NTY30_02290 [Candidatus Berkelbacteria bacterium]|nr:hypothetical protein [Candidatus Berkelbacteria bacterium]